jgi:kynurenine formamidase
VWRFGVPDDGLLTSTDFEKAVPPARPGDIVIVDTGWSDLIHDRRYAHHPSLSTDAAQWLVDERIALVGFDFLTPDLPVLRRPPKFRMPIHLIILGGGVLIIENVKTSPELAGRRVEVMVQPLPLVGADGSPVRLWARALRDAEEQGSRPESS